MLAFPQGGNQGDLYGSMAQQEETAEKLGTGREIMRGMGQVIGNKVMRILAELVLRDEMYKPVYAFRSREQEDDSPENLQEAVQTLQGNSYFKGVMDKMFFCESEFQDS